IKKENILSPIPTPFLDSKSHAASFNFQANWECQFVYHGRRALIGNYRRHIRLHFELDRFFLYLRCKDLRSFARSNRAMESGTFSNFLAAKSSFNTSTKPAMIARGVFRS